MKNIAQLFENNSIWLAEGSFVFKPKLKKAVPFGIKAIDKFLPYTGLVCGELHEIFPMDEKLRAPLSLISQIASQVISTFKFGFLFWMGRECWPVPHFLASRIDSSKEDFNTILLRSIFVNLPNERSKLWAIETALRSKGASAVISEVSHLPFVTTKRLSLAASKGGGVGLFIRNVKEINLPTSACTRWSISPTLSSSPNPRFNLQLLKHRGASLGKNSWICELCEPDQIDTLNSKLNNSCNTTLSGGALTTTKAS